MASLPEDIKPAMQGWIPSAVVTCSLDGTPNTSQVTQVYYIDENHVALSFQFFNKTVKNIRENPFACVQVRSAKTFERFILDLEYDHSETEGPVFDKMDMQIEALASITGMADVFKLKAADIYKVLSVTRLSTDINSPVKYRPPLGVIIGFPLLKLYLFFKKRILKK